MCMWVAAAAAAAECTVGLACVERLSPRAVRQAGM